MEQEEYWRHVSHRELINTVGHLTDARSALRKAWEHAKLCAHKNPAAGIMHDNIVALLEGLGETVTAAGIAVDHNKKQMQEPNAPTPIVRGRMDQKFKLTPYQRMLAREGVELSTQAETYRPTKTEARLPKLLTFTLRAPKKYKNRRRNMADGKISL